MKPNRLRAEIGTSPNAVKAQFLCRSREGGALKTSLAGTKYLEKLDNWKHYFDFEGPDFSCGNQYFSAGKCTYVRLGKFRFMVYSTPVLSMEYLNIYLGVLAKVEKNINPSYSLLRKVFLMNKPLSIVSKETSLKTME